MNRKYSLLIITIATIVLWNVPFGKLALYPFTILGTWFHEMAHGLTAIILGGTFYYLEIFSNGSGLAAYSGPLFLGPIGRALVAGAGPIGPTIAGFIFIISSVNIKATKFMLYFLSISLIVSNIIWMRSIFGFIVISVFVIIIILITLKANDKIKQFVLQLLGVQAFASVYMSIGYLFSTGANVDGSSFASDTQQMANNLLLPHFIWAGIILLFSAFMIFKSLQFVHKKTKNNHGKD